jgi:hypothetical protein
MTPDDFAKIEAELAITLPSSYKRLLSPFPIRALQGNSDADLWDGAEQLIAMNRELRTRSTRPWPPHWFFIGDPLTACANAIDLRHPSAGVSWIDHCDLRSVDPVNARPFEVWLQEWQSTEREYLQGEGIDPDGDPPDPVEPSWPARIVPHLMFGTIVLITVLGIVQIGIWAVRATKALIGH